ncbi:hypothetical protein FRC12_010452 [Ceratobasidium sp. 428]|nr:hypothetical protein FRC12_010452 [Ceratobasidium sp. 428]
MKARRTPSITKISFLRVQDAANLVLLPDKADGEPEYWNDKGALVPRLDKSFEENEGWLGEFDVIAADPTRMKKEKKYLQSVSAGMFREALKRGAFASMVQAWKQNQGGKGAERRMKKNRGARRSSRKDQKSQRRKTALEQSSDLPVRRLTFLVDPGFQSSEYSDPEDGTRCVIKERLFLAPDAKLLVGALDVKFALRKQRTGNRVYTKIDHFKENIAVPPLKGGGKVPIWAVDQGWLAANPELERASRPIIDKSQTEMPRADIIRQFIHVYEPKEKSYVDRCPDAAAPALAPALVPAPALALAPVEYAPALALAPEAALAPLEYAPAPQYVAHPAPPSYYPPPALANHFGPGLFQPEQFAPVEYGLGGSFLGMMQEILPMGGFEEDFNLGDAEVRDLSHPFSFPEGGLDAPNQLQHAEVEVPQIEPLAANPEVDKAEIAASLVEPTQGTRSSGRLRKPSARMREAAEAAAEEAAAEETTADKAATAVKDVAVLKPKFLKGSKAKGMKGGKGGAKGNGSAKGQGQDQNLVPGPSRKPFDASKIKKITVRPLQEHFARSHISPP